MIRRTTAALVAMVAMSGFHLNQLSTTLSTQKASAEIVCEAVCAWTVSMCCSAFPGMCVACGQSWSQCVNFCYEFFFSN